MYSNSQLQARESPSPKKRRSIPLSKIEHFAKIKLHLSFRSYSKQTNLKTESRVRRLTSSVSEPMGHLHRCLPMERHCLETRRGFR